MKRVVFSIIAFTSILNAEYVWKISPQDMAKLAISAGQESNIPPKVIYTISKIESGHNAYAFNGSNRNRTADMGLMQINSSWIPTLQRHGLYNPKDLYIPDYNVRVGAWVLRQCINTYGQSWKSIDCYNKGPKNAQNSSEYINRFISAYKSVPDSLFTPPDQLLASNP
ncbi:MAG: lytic transglycosylase domain-containing protein [Paludibacter sp.]|nr:lytic transglycosylase domain-containing protein [Paludibacter sp.]